MRKFTFRKTNKTADRSLQEKLVKKYFDDLDLNEPKLNAHDEGFDSDKIYGRIVAAMDEPSVKKSYNTRKWFIAASLVAGVCISVVTYYNRYKIMDVVSPVAMKQIEVRNGQIADVILGDGTHVWLNGGSKLTYPEKFRGKIREITLQGEAFLDVAHDSQRSFIVHTGNLKTQVLGTSFNVKAYAEDKYIKVDVVTGRVGVVAPVIKTVFLTPAQELTFNKEDHTTIQKQNVDVSTLTGWKDGELVFRNMMLPEVLNALQHRFNVQLKADANLSKCSITANFTSVSLKNIMVIISRLIKGEAVQDKFGYHIKGKGC
jgi:transmembrane sensor